MKKSNLGIRNVAVFSYFLIIWLACTFNISAQDTLTGKKDLYLPSKDYGIKTRSSFQDTICSNKALNFPFRKFGISIGNSEKFTGIRINFADINVKRVNGLNITFWHNRNQIQEEIVNGINLGILNFTKTVQPLSLGVLGSGAYQVNGLVIGGLGSVAYKLNGVALGGLFIECGNSNGITISGIATFDEGGKASYSGISLAGGAIYAGKAINGLSISGITIGTSGTINGLATSLGCIFSQNKINGIALTAGYLKADILNGFSFASYARTKKMHGLSIAIFNKTDELHGFQLGLLNYAGNNRKGFKMLPFINMHLRRKTRTD